MCDGNKLRGVVLSVLIPFRDFMGRLMAWHGVRTLCIFIWRVDVDRPNDAYGFPFFVFCKSAVCRPSYYDMKNFA
jgi:hypothetical protein